MLRNFMSSLMLEISPALPETRLCLPEILIRSALPDVLNLFLVVSTFSTSTYLEQIHKVKSRISKYIS